MMENDLGANQNKSLQELLVSLATQSPGLGHQRFAILLVWPWAVKVYRGFAARQDQRINMIELYKQEIRSNYICPCACWDLGWNCIHWPKIHRRRRLLLGGHTTPKLIYKVIAYDRTDSNMPYMFYKLTQAAWVRASKLIAPISPSNSCWSTTGIGDIKAMVEK